MTVTLFLTFALIACGHVLAQECLNETGDGPQLPSFPNQFSVEIEANILHFNLTRHVTEYYDNVNDRGRIETYSEFSNNVTLVDYNTMEVSHVMTINGSKSCFAASLNATSSRFARFLFGAQFANGTAHIVTPSQFLGLSEAFNWTYIGMDFVRGISCHRWQRCNGLLTNYTVDYYFTPMSWSPTMIPVQIVVNGTRPSNISDGTFHQVFNVYSFVNFRPGPADDNLFRVPPGLPCLGRINTKILPPLPNDYYSALYEITYSTFSVITYVREYYSYSQQLYRADFDQSFTNSTAIIEDFNEGVSYNINSHYGSCTIVPINAINSSASEVGSDGAVHLQSIKNHFLRQEGYNYTYEGISKVRNVDTESWISLRDREVFNNYSVLTDGYIQVFYKLPSWSIRYGYNRTANTSVPWRFVIAGNFSLLSQEENATYYFITYEVLESRIEEPDFDVFDVSVCYSINQYTTLQLILPLPYSVSYTSIDHSLLRSRVRSAFSQAANVSSSRLGGISILERSNNSLLLNLLILDPPPNFRNTNATPRDEIVSLLMQKANAGEVIIRLGSVTIVPLIRVPPTPVCTNTVWSTVTTVSVTTVFATTPVTVSVTAVSATKFTPYPTCNDSQDISGLSSGAAAGLTVALFMVGVIVGVISALITCGIMRNTKTGRFSTSSSSYNKQRDDVVI